LKTRQEAIEVHGKKALPFILSAELRELGGHGLQEPQGEALFLTPFGKILA
jgi:hypothetical protein